MCYYELVFDTGVKRKHYDMPAVSPVEISVKDMVNIGGKKDNTTVPLDLSDCGESKGCYRDPSDCEVLKCISSQLEEKRTCLA